VPDPDTPAGTAELLSSGPDRDPWRPSRRLVRATAALLAVVVAGAGAVRWQQHGDHVRDRRDAAVRSVAPVLLVDGLLGAGAALTVRNDGPETVQLLEVRLDAPAHETLRLSGSLLPGQKRALTPPDGQACASAIQRTRTTGATVVVSVRGTRVSRHVELLPPYRELLQELVAESCRWAPIEVSLNGYVTVEQRHRGSVALAFHLQNASGSTLRVLRLDSFLPWLDLLTADLPLTVPRQQGRETVLHVSAQARCADVVDGDVAAELQVVHDEFPDGPPTAVAIGEIDSDELLPALCP
jgi:hypothetical protein